MTAPMTAPMHSEASPPPRSWGSTWPAWLAAAAVIGTIVATAGNARDDGRACAEVTEYLDDAWTEARQASLGGDDAVAELSRHVSDWARERREVCHAAQVAANAGPRWSSRRRCLERWAETLVAGADWVEAGEIELSQLTAVVRSPERCRSARAKAPLPADPERLAHVLAGRSHLVRGELRIALGQDAKAAESLAIAMNSFRTAAHPALELETLSWAQSIPPVSDAGLFDLAERAAAIGEDRTAARALARLAWGRHEANVLLGPEVAAWGRSSVERADDPVARGFWALAQGQTQVGFAELREGLGPGHAWVRALSARP
jgi:hypothetical protein